MSWKIIGRITTKEDNKAIPGLIVQAWDKDLENVDEYLGDARTDELGEFRIEFSQEDFSHWGTEEAPDLYLVVKNENDAIIHSTEERVKWDIKEEEYVYVRIPKDLLTKKPETDPANRAEQIRRILEGK